MLVFAVWRHWVTAEMARPSSWLPVGPRHSQEHSGFCQLGQRCGTHFHTPSRIPFTIPSDLSSKSPLQDTGEKKSAKSLWSRLMSALAMLHKDYVGFYGGPRGGSALSECMYVIFCNIHTLTPVWLQLLPLLTSANLK